MKIMASEHALEIQALESDGAINDGETYYSRVATLMRQDIASGRLIPNQWLKVRMLADRYGVSAAPVREALQVLQAEGLVTLEHNRGARVRGIDQQRVIHIYEVKEALESYLAAAFADSASPYQISLLEEVQDRHDLAAQEGRYMDAFFINREFHEIINNASRNSEVLEILTRHYTLIKALRASCGFSEARIQAIGREHRQLIENFKQRDAVAARNLAALHARSTRDDLLSRFPQRLRGQTTI